MITWLARHRVALAVALAAFCPFPTLEEGYIPVGIALLVIAPSLGFWGAGYSGVGGGGPLVLLLLGFVLLAWAAALWAALTGVLRRRWMVNVAWWPPTSPPAAWPTKPAEATPPGRPLVCPRCGARYPSRYYFVHPDLPASFCTSCAGLGPER